MSTFSLTLGTFQVTDDWIGEPARFKASVDVESTGFVNVSSQEISHSIDYQTDS